MTNPFQVRWLQGWSFEVMLMEGKVQVEAKGFGIKLRTPVYPGETPHAAADRLVLAEDRRRRSLYQAWRRSRNDSGLSASVDGSADNPINAASVVIVPPQLLAA